MKTTTVALIVLCFASFLHAKENGESVLVRSNPQTYRIESGVDVAVTGTLPTMVIVNLSLPLDNPYQDVKNLKITQGAPAVKQAVYPETRQLYISALFRNTSGASVRYECEVTFYDFETNFSKITEIHPYDKKSPIYRAYTGASGVYVVPNHPKITAVAETLSKDSKDVLDYARKAYVYVAENFKYLNPNTGLHPLEKILRDGGADCGNLSSIYVSLLRCKGIPARHLVGVRPDGSAHVWADFYLEKYGWIPVDVTNRNSDLRGDYFGKKSGAGQPVIVCIGVDLTVNSLKDGRIQPQKTALMQNFTYWYQTRANDTIITPTHFFREVKE